MKQRTEGFLGEDKIDQHGEIFQYIVELHLILWEVCRFFHPGASGELNIHVDDMLSKIRSKRVMAQED